uniref:DENN domain-containing protein 1A-like n=1 Tax=Styela clava TaxID=7725 RepID=UPI00193ABBC5|nr:DENN domain-containing protein 1A-like [Styela clava]
MDTQNGEESKIFHCFFIANLGIDEISAPIYFYPKDASDNKELRQYQKFCFPFKKSDISAIGQRHQHFAFMLTDLDKTHTYGFCKLVDSGRQCYCFISPLPWFEIFYKFLNCVRTIHSRNDLNTLQLLLDDLYLMPIPKPKVIVNVSSSLTFCAPDENDLPSIPENRNMMEYISAIHPKNMLEIFAALMFERRIIFAATSLSILTGCIFAAEALLFPLTWQHIFIPLLPQDIIDYCHAPMPFIVGLHASLLPLVQQSALSDGVVIVDIDEKTVTTPYDDLDNMPSEATSFLRSHLGKPNIAVGTNLAEAFLKTQARLIGGYRSALKFRMGESIVFDDEKFIELHKVGSRRNFAESLVQLQTFREFVDKRMEMLNNGIGFRDAFENEVTELQRHNGENGNAMYKEWLTVSRKGNEFIYNVKKHAKSNMKSARESARQSMRDMKIAVKEIQKEKEASSPRPSSLKSRQSLRENIRPMRPPRPPPPRPIPESPSESPESKHKPTRPPPPKPTRRYNLIDNDFDSIDHNRTVNNNNSLEIMATPNDVTPERESNSSLLIDLSDWQTSTNKNFDKLFNNDAWDKAAQGQTAVNSEQKMSGFENELFNFSEESTQTSKTILPKHRTSSIRRAEHVKSRPLQIVERQQELPDGELLLGLFDNNNKSSNEQSKSSMDFNWESFENSNTKDIKTKVSTQSTKSIDGPLISFD